VGTNSVNAL